MPPTLRVLHVEDSEKDVLLLSRHLTRAGYNLVSERVEEVTEMRTALESRQWDVVLCDYAMPKFDALQALALVKEMGLDVPFIIISGTVGEALAVEAMRAGAHDYLMKDNLTRLSATIERELQEAENRRARRLAETELRRSEARYRRLLETTYEGVWMVDTEGRTTYTNQRLTEMLGFSAEEMLNKTPLDFLDDASRAEMEGWQQRETSNFKEQYDLHLRRKDGSELWAIVCATPIHDENEEFAGILSMLTDITARKRDEEQQARLTAKLALRSEVNAALAQIHAPWRRILEDCTAAVVRNLNAAFARIWTFNREENVLELQASSGIYTHIDGPHARVPVGAFKIGLIAEELQPHITNDVQRDPRVSDKEWARREGMAAFAGYPLVVEERLVGVLAMFSRNTLSEDALDALSSVADIIAQHIERKRAEQALRRSDESYRNLVENAHDIIYSHDLEGNYLSVNRAAEQITGYSTEESLKLNFAQTVTPESLPVAKEMIRRKLNGEEGTAYELDILAKDGRTVTVEVNSKLMYKEGIPVGIQGIARDISERKRMEKALRESEAQLRQAQKMEAVGRLAGGVAHDFNNLLTAINGYSALALRRTAESDPLRGYLEEIKKAGERAAGLTRQLLAFGRKQMLQPVALNLNDVIADLNRMLRRLIGEDVKLTAKFDPALAKTRADPGQIEQVIVNLAVNARDAMPNGGHLTIETANFEVDQNYAATHIGVAPGRYVMLAVSDTGTGMDDETKAHIFEPFFTTKEKGKGTGLGLSTVYGIVKQSGGNIWVYSEPNQGTVFKIYLPQLKDAVPVEEKVIEEADEPGGSETVLLVEDEDVVRGLARKVLEQAGYRVLEASRGEEAIRLCQENHASIDLLLTDVVMPEMSGAELAKRITSVHSGMRVLFMSGYTDEAVVHHGIVDSGVHFIQKPFSPASLAKKIREVLDAD